MNAFNELKEGKKLKHDEWEDKYIIMKDEIIILIDSKQKTAHNYIVETKDLFFNNWLVIK